MGEIVVDYRSSSSAAVETTRANSRVRARSGDCGRQTRPRPACSALVLVAPRGVEVLGQLTSALAPLAFVGAGTVHTVLVWTIAASGGYPTAPRLPASRAARHRRARAEGRRRQGTPAPQRAPDAGAFTSILSRLQAAHRFGREPDRWPNAGQIAAAAAQLQRERDHHLAELARRVEKRAGRRANRDQRLAALTRRAATHRVPQVGYGGWRRRRESPE